MRRLMLISAVCLCLALGACVTDPSTGKRSVDWPKVSDYYHRYMVGLIAPAGATAAAILVPEARPLIALATTEVGRLDALIAGKAQGVEIERQAQTVQAIIDDINKAVGKGGQ